MNALKLLPLVFCICLAPETAFAQKVGDWVIVIHERTPILVKEAVVQNVNRGLALKVEDVNGEWLWVSTQSAGWIDRQHVTTPASAIELFTSQIQQNPQDAEGYIVRGMVRYTLGEIDLALRDFNEAIRLNPKRADAYVDRGRCWSNKGETNKALADYNEAIRLNPEDALAYGNRAAESNRKLDLDRSVADASEAIRLAPTFAAAYSIRATAWAGKKQFEKASADCSEARRIDPKAAPYNNVAWFLATNPEAKYRDGQKAVDYGIKACELSDWKDAADIDTLAAAYAEAGEFDRAIEWENKAIELAEGKAKTDFQSHLRLYKSKKPYHEKPKALNWLSGLTRARVTPTDP